jgi:hypothetical protein
MRCKSHQAHPPRACIHKIAIGNGDLIKSALDRFSDSSQTPSEVREVPGAAVSRCSKMRDKGMLNLFNDLVGAAEEQEWHGKAERLSGLEVDDQLDLGGLSHRQVSWLLALEN